MQFSTLHRRRITAASPPHHRFNGQAVVVTLATDVNAPNYRLVLLDLDHTLLDSDASEARAFAQTMSLAGISEPSRHFATYDQINRALWAAVERGEVSPQHVRIARFEQFAAATGLDLDPAAMAESFVAGLGMHGDLYPGARDALATLAERVSLALVTNGLSEVQRTRLERLDLAEFFDAVIISSEVGVSKPAPGIFDIAFQHLGTDDRTSALMVGDSLSSDIRGGLNAGIATCWFNPHGHQPGVHDRFDHQIGSIGELPTVVFGSA